jgi:hypothetical protein
MTRFAVFLLSAASLFPFAGAAQQTTATLPDAPKPAQSPYNSAGLSYAPPTQAQRFKTYIRHTYSFASLVEDGVRGGIEQARDNPSQWPEGAEGYGDRYGSAMGKIIVRDTTDYLVADLFRGMFAVRHRVRNQFSNLRLRIFFWQEEGAMAMKLSPLPVWLDRFQAKSWPTIPGIRVGKDGWKQCEVRF